MKLLLALDDSASPDQVAAIRKLSEQAAAVFGRPVSFAQVDKAVLRDLQAWISIKTDGDGLAGIAPPELASSTARRAQD